MKFWLMTLSYEMVIPILLLIYTRYFQMKVSSTIDPKFGYRTKRSMKSQKVWYFSQAYYVDEMYKTSIALIVATIAAMIPVINDGEEFIGNWGRITCLVQLFFIARGHYMVKRAVKMRFDDNGTERPVDLRHQQIYSMNHYFTIRD